MKHIPLALAMLALAACSGAGKAAAPIPPGDIVTAAEVEVIESLPTVTPASNPAPTPTASPTVAISPTPIPTPAVTSTRPVPTPLPTDQRRYNLCVGIASDSNGYGHVTFEVPGGEVAIVYITPLWVPLQEHLKALGLSYLEVRDRSLSAGGLTIRSANYRASDQYYLLRRDACQFIIVTPFYPDVAVDLATPEYYVENLRLFVDETTRAAPESTLLILNFYQTDRAAFTVNNMGRGLRPERIAAFNRALAEACAEGGVLAAYEQVRCVDIRPFFEDLGAGHVLGLTTREEFEAMLWRETGYTPAIWAYFEQHPDGTITGDGVHLSLAGRDRLAAGLARLILELSAGP